MASVKGLIQNHKLHRGPGNLGWHNVKFPCWLFVSLAPCSLYCPTAGPGPNTHGLCQIRFWIQYVFGDKETSQQFFGRCMQRCTTERLKIILRPGRPMATATSRTVARVSALEKILVAFVNQRPLCTYIGLASDLQHGFKISHLMSVLHTVHTHP